MENKKSIQLNQAFGAVLTLVLVAVLIVVAIVIFVSLQTSFAGTSSVTVTNETGGFINQTGYTLDGASDCEFASPVITEARNSTSGGVILAGNFTVSSVGIVTNITTTNFPNAEFDYTYTFGSGACTAANDLVTEFGTYTSLIGLVGTIIFLGLVIGILVTAFAFGGRREV